MLICPKCRSWYTPETTCVDKTGLLAYRKYALAMLKRAEEKEVFGGKLKIKVIKVEDQIGLKV